MRLIVLTGWRDFFQTRRRLEPGGQGRKPFSRSFLPLFQTCTAKGQLRGQNQKRKNKHEISKLNSHSDGDCLHWAFAKSASGKSAARWRLPWVQYGGRGKSP